MLIYKDPSFAQHAGNTDTCRIDRIIMIYLAFRKMI